MSVRDQPAFPRMLGFTSHPSSRGSWRTNVDPAYGDDSESGLTIREFVAALLYADHASRRTGVTAWRAFVIADIFCDELDRQRAKGESDV